MIQELFVVNILSVSAVNTKASWPQIFSRSVRLVHVFIYSSKPMFRTLRILVPGELWSLANISFTTVHTYLSARHIRECVFMHVRMCGCVCDIQYEPTLKHTVAWKCCVGNVLLEPFLYARNQYHTNSLGPFIKYLPVNNSMNILWEYELHAFQVMLIWWRKKKTRINPFQTVQPGHSENVGTISISQTTFYCRATSCFPALEVNSLLFSTENK